MSYIENTSIENTSGNILIKHKDKWRGDFYLKDDLTFTTIKSQASHFYILKPGNTTIINGDRISINLGNQTVMVEFNCKDQVKLIDRDLFNHNINSFIIIGESENTNPITYETSVFFISNKKTKEALKYEWNMDLVTGVNDPVNNSTKSVINYQPRNQPSLINSNYNNFHDVSSFQFFLEKVENTITYLNTVPAVSHKKNNVSGAGYNSVIILILLIIVLILCILINK